MNGSVILTGTGIFSFPFALAKVVVFGVQIWDGTCVCVGFRFIGHHACTNSNSCLYRYPHFLSFARLMMSIIACRI